MSPFSVKRIDQGHFSPLEIPHIACDHHQIVNDRRRRNQTVRRWQRFWAVQPTPKIRYLLVHRQNMIRIRLHQALQIFLKPRRSLSVISPLQFDPHTDFTQRDHTQIKSLRQMVTKPPLHALVTSPSPFQFRDHICVQQITSHSNSTLRWAPVSLDRSGRKSSGHASPSFIKNSTKLGRFTSALERASFKIRRCSSSADTPCASARRFNFRTSTSSRFRTSNCAMDQGDSIAIDCQTQN